MQWESSSSGQLVVFWCYFQLSDDYEKSFDDLKKETSKLISVSQTVRWYAVLKITDWFPGFGSHEFWRNLSMNSHKNKNLRNTIKDCKTGSHSAKMSAQRFSPVVIPIYLFETLTRKPTHHINTLNMKQKVWVLGVVTSQKRRSFPWRFSLDWLGKNRQEIKILKMIWTGLHICKACLNCESSHLRDKTIHYLEHTQPE